ncbi:MAG: hypothetical protein NC218_01935 [Acetobacter sp.]|nr:hypothetical protein [Acetobacter sp.]
MPNVLFEGNADNNNDNLESGLVCINPDQCCGLKYCKGCKEDGSRCQFAIRAMIAGEANSGKK